MPGQRAANLTRQLLAFSRRQLLAAAGRVAELARDRAGAHARPAGWAPTVTLETELDPALGNVLVDPARLEQVLVNLVLNAREAMPRGWPDPDHHRQLARRGRAARAAPVRDTSRSGSAIPASGWMTRPRAESSSRSSRPSRPGAEPVSASRPCTASWSRVAGTSRLRARPGEGSTFGIHLPRLPGARDRRSREQRAAAVGKETLLLVEDETPVRESVRRLLEWHGYTVLEARNGADALEIYEDDQHGIDLVLTDLVMPEMGGHELVERLRARNPGAAGGVHVGLRRPAIDEQRGGANGHGFVEKPFTVETLMQRLREVLEGSGKA